MLHVTSVGETTATLERVDLNDQVYATLKERLASPGLAPGEKLSLHELASAFGVSRSPVQHALTRLAAEGLVEVKPHRGHFVRPLTAEVVCEAYRVREALELHAAERTVGRLSPAQLARLRALMERTLTMLDGPRIADRGGYIKTNHAFHDYQVSLAGNTLLLETYRSLSVNQLMARVLSGGNEDGGAVAGEHVALVEAFEASDRASALRVIRAHVATGMRLTRAALEQAGGVL
jgi:DNA-binding GntR family transcriptional regulator